MIPSYNQGRFLEEALRSALDQDYAALELLVVDGGQPQVAAAARALKDAGHSEIALCGIAKRLEEVWLPGEDYPVILPRTSEALYLLQRLRDEAHGAGGRVDRAAHGHRGACLEGRVLVGPRLLDGDLPALRAEHDGLAAADGEREAVEHGEPLAALQVHGEGLADAVDGEDRGGRGRGSGHGADHPCRIEETSSWV